MSNSQGTTLVELIAAIAVLVVLVLAGIAILQSSMERSGNAKCISNLRSIGGALLSYAADNQNSIPTAYNDLEPDREPGSPNQTWATRLLLGGYVSGADVLFCPVFFPRNNAEATRKPENNGAVQSYGMRRWVPPGTLWLNHEISNGWKKLATIESPSAFFLVADSYWPPWKSQGYAITPAAEEHRVHLRHSNMANALFADGHVEPKDEAYFKSLSNTDANGGQRAYTGGREKEIYTIKLEETPP